MHVLHVNEAVKRKNNMNRSNYLCPICNVHLAIQDMLNGSVATWCTYKDCPSLAANRGAESKTEEGAVHKLERAVEIEVNQNNEHGPMCGCECCMSKTLEEWNRSL